MPSGIQRGVNLIKMRGAVRATRYTWSFAAARLRRLYADLGVRERVACG